MGEVYRALDRRLSREVAVKVLSRERSGPDQVQRLEQEARALGALAHPNVVAVFDVGTDNGISYVVSELLEGETLRARLSVGPLAPRRAMEVAIQVAEGLAAAHDKGICHRDLKPENLFVTKDGRVKVLDFGLAKLTFSGGLARDADSASPTGPVTDPGTVLGTVGYMSPEQVRGQPADHRSDIFAFGAILYELLFGERAFHGPSAAETLSTILRDEPPRLSESHSRLPAGLTDVVAHCLEKKPEERFQSARDLAFDLRQVQVRWQSTGAAAVVPPVRWFGLRHVLVALAATALLVAGLLAGRLLSRLGPAFHQITFRRGVVLAARFLPGGEGVVYTGAWEGRPPEAFLTLTDGVPEARPLGDPGACALAVSPAGEMALLLGCSYAGGNRVRGTLARAAVTGGAPRPLLEDVEDADWAPDGAGLAVVHAVGEGARLEYPAGHPLYTTGGTIRHPRVAPDGESVAFLDDPTGFSGAVAVVDRAGRKRTLTPVWNDARGLAWSPDGAEIWFAAGAGAGLKELRAVSLAGRQRLVIPLPGSVALHDIGRDGRVLLATEKQNNGILARVPGQDGENELASFDAGLGDLSNDGRRILLDDRFGVHLRPTDGGAATRLAAGLADTLSPDGRIALVTSLSTEALSLVQTGPGEPQPLPRHGIVSYRGAHWFPDGRRVFFNGREQRHELRTYVQALAGGAPRPVTAEGTRCVAVSPDGATLACVRPGAPVLLQSADGGEPRPLAGSVSGDRPIAWSRDGRFLWTFQRGSVPARVDRIELGTGRRTPWKTLTPPDPAGVLSFIEVRITPDGSAYAYSYRRILSDLHLATGLQ